MAKAWGIDAEFREMALKAAETKVDRKNGYLEFIKDVEGIVYTVQAAMFLGEDGSPLVAVSFDKGDATLGLTSIVFYRAQGSGWVEVHPLPHLFESDFKIPKGNIGCPTCMLVYSFKLPRQGTVVEARAQYRSFPRAGGHVRGPRRVRGRAQVGQEERRLRQEVRGLVG
jgi:hypothetical protein